ncbi:MAG: tetratricopeptide repeat protein [Deltaproteobacteria bacterium]|nr:tetratricopeptide repeat protein [Deltaproteobacteria bacterium]
MMGRASWLVSGALCVLVAAARAVAQPAPGPDAGVPAPVEPPTVTSEETEAARLTQVGSEAWQRGDHAQALQYFQLAYRVFPSPRLHYNLALALLGQRRTLEAVAELERFLAEAPDAPADARDYASEQLAELGKHLGRVLVEAPAGASISLDGQPAAGITRVAAGRHSVLVRAEGMRAFLAEIEVRAGALTTVRARLTPWTDDGAASAAAPTSPAPTRPAPAAPRRARAGGVRWWVLGAFGAAVVGAGLAVWLTGGEVACPGSDLGCVRVAR